VARPKSTVSVVSGDIDQFVQARETLTDDKLNHLETVWGVHFDDIVRERIKEIVGTYLTLYAAERQAASMQKLTEHLALIRSKVNELLEIIQPHPLSGSKTDIENEAFYYMNEWLASKSNAPISSVSEAWAANQILAEATVAAIKAAKSAPKSKMFIAGSAWIYFVNELTNLAKESRFSYSSRKDEDKSQNKSPFTLFVHDLLKALPDEHHRQSEGATAAAIASGRASRSRQ